VLSDVLSTVGVLSVALASVCSVVPGMLANGPSRVGAPVELATAGLCFLAGAEKYEESDLCLSFARFLVAAGGIGASLRAKGLGVRR
jgi:hypothetical protein